MVDGDALLLHGVAEAYGDAVVVESIVVDGDAEGRTYGILSAVALTDGVFLVVVGVEVVLEQFDDFVRFLGQSVFLDEGHDACFDRSEHRRQVEYDTCVSPFELLLFVSGAHDAEEHTVDADRCLDDVGGVTLVEFRVEVLYLLSTVFSVLGQVEVGAAVDALYLFESEGHEELDVGSGVGVVCEFLVVVEAVFVVTEAECLVPFESELFPVGEPLHLLAWAHEELHLHLLELTHTEDELSCDNLVAEGFTYLCDTERNLHASGLLYVEEVDEDTLCRLGSEVDGHGAVGGAAHLCLEHEVELANVGPVACTADRADYFLVQDDLFEFC